MQSEDVCPLCDSTNTSGKDWDNDIYGRRLQYIELYPDEIAEINSLLKIAKEDIIYG